MNSCGSPLQDQGFHQTAWCDRSLIPSKRQFCSLPLKGRVREGLNLAPTRCDREFSPKLDAALQRGIEEGLQQGIQQGQRLIIENLLQTRLGQLTPTLSALITPLSALPPQQLTPFLLQLSQLENSESGIAQAQHFIVGSGWVNSIMRSQPDSQQAPILFPPLQGEG
ncbi:hypothetical protein [Coleofasciculus sp. G2-EDA-02]|uniref:hypothetical protein n=1 Tax=Coleofasciculus sp. G2-EDA-02 TaxID=3069529 RepID=UPI0032FA4A1E